MRPVADPGKAPRNLGVNLRAVRVGLNLSQEEVGQRAGLQQGEVSRIEAGKRDPQVSTLIRLADALGINPGSLLEAPAEESGGEAASLDQPVRRLSSGT